MKIDLKKLKAADKPRKKEKAYQPPGTTGRKVGAIVFWFLFGFMVLVVFTTVSTKDDESETVIKEEEENPATTEAATSFAKEFAAAYFTWQPTADGFKERETVLEPMMADGLDAQAGLITANLEWQSEAGAARVLAIEETGENQALITLEIEQKLTLDKDDEAKAETAIHSFAVPVAFSEAYGVYDLPSFTAISQETEVEEIKLEGEIVPGETETNIKNFLPTFFQSYTTDTPDKLAYFLEAPGAVKGLEGSLMFEKVQEAKMVQGDAAGEYIVQAAVVLKEKTTKTGFVANYWLTVKEENGRYIVKNMNEGVY